MSLVPFSPIEHRLHKPHPLKPLLPGYTRYFIFYPSSHLNLVHKFLKTSAWVATTEPVRLFFRKVYPSIPLTLILAGGKAKPLKAPKKEKKEMDEDDLAFIEKQKAGMLIGPCL